MGLARLLSSLHRILPGVSLDCMPDMTFRVSPQTMMGGESPVVDLHKHLTEQEKHESVAAHLRKCLSEQVKNGSEEIHSYRLMR